MFQTLFTLRYRTGALGVSTGFIVASDLHKAAEVGEKWCNLEPNRKYIGVTPAVLADERLLASETPAAAPASPPPDQRRSKAS